MYNRSMDQWLPSFVDELEKIAVSRRLSHFPQERQGRRPIRVAKMIEKESSSEPFTDQEIVAVLKEDGIQIARRTVAKYRDQLGILPARMRKRV